MTNADRVVALALLLAGTAGQAASAATIAVDAFSDDATQNGNCTLREAIQAAQTNSTVDECPAGTASGADVVLMPAGAYVLVLGEIAVSGGDTVVRGPATPAPAASLTVFGSGRFLSLGGGARMTIEGLEVLGGGSDRGGAIFSESSDLTLRRVRLADSQAVLGGGLYFDAPAGQHLVVERSLFESNRAYTDEKGFQASGGGAAVYLRGKSSALIVDSDFRSNEAISMSTYAPALGGGLRLSAGDQARARLLRTAAIDNGVSPGLLGTGEGGGIRVGVSDQAVVVIEDLEARGNGLGLYQGGRTLSGGGLSALLRYDGELLLDRARFVGNLGSAETRQLSIAAYESSSLLAADVVVGAGLRWGADVYTEATASALLGHWTVASNLGPGLVLTEAGNSALRVESSVLWDNDFELLTTGTPDVDPTVITDVDPLFVDPAAGDWSLGSGSPAIDAGDRTFGSVRPFDAAHAPRVVGPEPDLGAYEFDGLFADDFESADTGAWSAAVP